MDSFKPVASALVIDQGRVLAIGDDELLKSRYLIGVNAYGDQDGYLDLQGKVIIPGLTDSHIHMEQLSLGLKKVNCETQTKAECLSRVSGQVKLTAPGDWILGHGWNQNNWPEGFGSVEELDAAAPNHPVYLTAKSLHAAWVNSAALRLAGIDQNTSDPPGGRIGRFEDGKLSGILFESAMDLVSGAIPEPNEADVAQAIESAQPILWKMGLTGVHDFDRERCFSAMQILHARGALKLRVTKSIPLENLDHAIALGLRSGFGDDFLRIGSVKAFADGALGPQTAAMIQPYLGTQDNRGMLFLDAEELFEHGQKAVRNGLSMAIHAIGDRANHEVLDAFTQLREFEHNLPHNEQWEMSLMNRLRHRIEHLQVIHPDDADRLARLGVIASMQPLHATSDMLMADRYWGDRAAMAYAWRTQSNNGAILAFGSDAPVESPNPFWGIHAAVTRQRPDGSPGKNGWYPEQRLSVKEALQAYTTGAAYASLSEDRAGKLAPGYFADLLVLEKDPFTCSMDELYTMSPLATMVAGEWVFSKL